MLTYYAYTLYWVQENKNFAIFNIKTVLLMKPQTELTCIF